MREYTATFTPTEGDCNPEQRMSLPLLVTKLFEIAACHASVLDIGYEKLSGNNLRWVVTRLALEMERYPRVNEQCSVVTWIEEYNRHFSQRNFEITGCDGEKLGYARTVWLVINADTRETGETAGFDGYGDITSPRLCPIERQSRLMPVKAGVEMPYTFQYVDIDSNRHVNSTRYIELLMNHWSLEHYDRHYIRRFELTYIKECLYGMKVTVRFDDSDPMDCKAEIEADGVSHLRARIKFAERDYSRDIEEKMRGQKKI